MDEFDDQELTAALRGRAEALTADVVDTDAAFAVVRQRARTRRRRRQVAGGALAAAAAVVGVLAVTSIAGDDAVVRTPATSPAVETTTASETTTTTPVTVAPTTPATTTAATTATGVPPVPTPVTGVVPGSITATTTYDSAGGSITVRLANGVISLAEDPAPAPGFSVRIDDDGPDRVRVRFELDDRRSEIRVDLENGALIPEIIEG